MNNRIVKLIKAEGLTNSKFASILGIQRSNVTHIIDGRNKPSISFIEKLINKFPHINVEWLISGKGEMYKQNEMTVHKSGQKKGNSPTLFSNVLTDKNIPEPESKNIPEIEEKTETTEETETIEEKTEKETTKLEIKDEIPLSIQNTETDDNIENMREIECVLIFHSDKTFKYYKPV
jgi:transcriptional regulator with XRE-family HTH domain